MKTAKQNKIDFRTSAPQTIWDPWSLCADTLRYMGKCVLCGRRTYAFDSGSNDPRGSLGDHAADPLVASEYSMVGPDVPACFFCQNDTSKKYERILAIAKRQWKGR
jgi:hypothetical protein